MSVKFNFSTEYDENVGKRLLEGIRSQRYQVASEFFEADGSAIGREGVNITLRDAGENLIGGLVGSTFFGGLHIHWLWVDEAHRNNGYAREMIQQAVEVAKKRGCTFAWFDTWSVQGAYTLYEKLGAKVVMRMDNFPLGSALLHYRLDFDDITWGNS
jgi:GNAT superfamily N-acetyltransferase